MRTFLSSLATLFVAFALPSLTVAQEPAPVAQPALADKPDPMPNRYVAAKVGAPIPVASNLDGLGPKFSVEAALGYRFNESVAMEFGLGGFNIDGSQTFVNAVGDTVTASGIFTASWATVTGKFSLPAGKLEFYGLAGLGVYRIKGQIKLNDALGRGSADQTDTDTTFGLSVGGGLAFRLSTKVQLGAEAKYIIGNEHTFDGTGRFDTIIVAGCLTYSF